MLVAKCNQLVENVIAILANQKNNSMIMKIVTLQLNFMLSGAQNRSHTYLPKFCVKCLVFTCPWMAKYVLMVFT